MKNIFFLPIWIVIGVGMAFIILKFQWLSVFMIRPDKPKSSKWLIIGGAIIRWIIIAIIFIVAGSFSIMSLLVVFVSFMMSRLFILNVWQKSFNAKKDNIH